MASDITINDTALFENKTSELITISDSTHRIKDQNGHLIVKDNPIATAGVFPFLRGTVDPYCPQDNKNEVTYVLRSEASLRDAVDLFRDKPIVHHHTWVGKDGDRNHADGHIGSQVYYKDGSIYGDLIIYNPELIDAIESGQCTQLSAGYNAKVAKDSGVYDNQCYSYSILYTGVNHLGVVEQGRAGVKLSIRDGKEIVMDNNNAHSDNKVNKRAGNNYTNNTQVDKKEVATQTTRNQEGNQAYKKDVVEGMRGHSRIQADSSNRVYRDDAGGNNNLRGAFRTCIQKMKRGEMNSDQMHKVMDSFHKQVSYNSKGINLLNTKQRELDNKIKSFEKEKERAQALDKAVREIQEYVPSWRAYDGADASVQYSRFYTYLTKQKLPEGMDARTASLTIAKQSTQKSTHAPHMDALQTDASNQKVAIIESLYNDNYPRFLDMQARLRRS